MNRSEAASLARRLMNEHGLGHVPFEFDRAKRRMGATHFLGNKVLKITLSHHCVAVMDEDELRNTILHEIAHAIAGRDAGHGATWRTVARQVGANPTRCGSIAAGAPVDHTWIAKCPQCGNVRAKFHRAPTAVRSCSQCGKGKFNTRYILKWFKDGHEVSVYDMPSKYRLAHGRALDRADNPFSTVASLDDLFRF